MNDLRIDLSLVTEEGYTVDAVVPGELLQPNRAMALPLGPVSVQGRMTKTGETYVFLGSVCGNYETTCDRCLDPTSVAFEAEAIWAFAQGEPETPLDAGTEFSLEDAQADEAADITHFSGSEIDLAPRAWEEAVFAIPPKFLCKETCAGLCPRCGANLNREACACREDNAQGPWENKGLAGLEKLFPDLPKKPSED